MKKYSESETETYFSIRTELEKYEKNGIIITLEGKVSSSDVIADICVFKEDSNYMRDYITNEFGNLIEIGFNRVENK